MPIDTPSPGWPPSQVDIKTLGLEEQARNLNLNDPKAVQAFRLAVLRVVNEQAHHELPVWPGDDGTRSASIEASAKSLLRATGLGEERVVEEIKRARFDNKGSDAYKPPEEVAARRAEEQRQAAQAAADRQARAEVEARRSQAFKQLRQLGISGGSPEALQNKAEIEIGRRLAGSQTSENTQAMGEIVNLVKQATDGKAQISLVNTPSRYFITKYEAAIAEARSALGVSPGASPEAVTEAGIRNALNLHSASLNRDPEQGRLVPDYRAIQDQVRLLGGKPEEITAIKISEIDTANRAPQAQEILRRGTAVEGGALRIPVDAASRNEKLKELRVTLDEVLGKGAGNSVFKRQIGNQYFLEVPAKTAASLTWYANKGRQSPSPGYAGNIPQNPGDAPNRPGGPNARNHHGEDVNGPGASNADNGEPRGNRPPGRAAAVPSADIDKRVAGMVEYYGPKTGLTREQALSLIGPDGKVPKGTLDQLNDAMKNGTPARSIPALVQAAWAQTFLSIDEGAFKRATAAIDKAMLALTPDGQTTMDQKDLLGRLANLRNNYGEAVAGQELPHTINPEGMAKVLTALQELEKNAPQGEKQRLESIRTEVSKAYNYVKAYEADRAINDARKALTPSHAGEQKAILDTLDKLSENNKARGKGAPPPHQISTEEMGKVMNALVARQESALLPAEQQKLGTLQSDLGKVYNETRGTTQSAPQGQAVKNTAPAAPPAFDRTAYDKANAAIDEATKAVGPRDGARVTPEQQAMLKTLANLRNNFDAKVNGEPPPHKISAEEMLKVTKALAAQQESALLPAEQQRLEALRNDLRTVYNETRAPGQAGGNAPPLSPDGQGRDGNRYSQKGEQRQVTDSQGRSLDEIRWEREQQRRNATSQAKAPQQPAPQQQNAPVQEPPATEPAPRTQPQSEATPSRASANPATKPSAFGGFLSQLAGGIARNRATNNKATTALAIAQFGPTVKKTVEAAKAGKTLEAATSATQASVNAAGMIEGLHLMQQLKRGVPLPKQAGKIGRKLPGISAFDAATTEISDGIVDTIEGRDPNVGKRMMRAGGGVLGGLIGFGGSAKGAAENYAEDLNNKAPEHDGRTLLMKSEWVQVADFISKQAGGDGFGAPVELKKLQQAVQEDAARFGRIAHRNGKGTEIQNYKELAEASAAFGTRNPEELRKRIEEAEKIDFSKIPPDLSQQDKAKLAKTIVKLELAKRQLGALKEAQYAAVMEEKAERLAKREPAYFKGAEFRLPNFQQLEKEYIEANPDAAEAIKKGQYANAFEHFAKHFKEGKSYAGFSRNDLPEPERKRIDALLAGDIDARYEAFQAIAKQAEIAAENQKKQQELKARTAERKPTPVPSDLALSAGEIREAKEMKNEIDARKSNGETVTLLSGQKEKWIRVLGSLDIDPDKIKIGKDNTITVDIKAFEEGYKKYVASAVPENKDISKALSPEVIKQVQIAMLGLGRIPMAQANDVAVSGTPHNGGGKGRA